MDKTIEPSLEGKVALVTGAGKGIGRAIALAYATHGAAVCCAGRTVRDLDTLVSDIRARDGKAIAVATDVTDPDAVQRLIGACTEAFGRLDILVINAGIEPEGVTIEESDITRWRHTLDVNLFGAYYCARAAIPAMRAGGGGKIITIGSGLGHRGLPRISDYSCAKAGLWMLTRVLAQELAPYAIDVNELIPGPVVTAMTSAQVAQQHLDENPALKQEWVKQPDDLLPLALFLASQPPRGPTGQCFSLARREI